MSARASRALEPSPPVTWLQHMAHGARKLAHEAAVLLAMDEPMMLYQRDARARVFISMIPVHDGINIMDSGDLYSNPFHGFGVVDGDDKPHGPGHEFPTEDAL